MAVRVNPLGDLRLDLDLRHVIPRGEPSHVDLVVEMADVPDDGLMLHLRHMFLKDDVAASRGGDEDVTDAHHRLKPRHLEPIHRGLQGADRIDLGDDHTSPLAPQRLRAALTHVAVAAHHRHFAADQHVSSPVDAVDQGVAAAVLVVELGLGHRVIHVDGPEQQVAAAVHLIEAMNPGGRLLSDPEDTRGQGLEIQLSQRLPERCLQGQGLL